MAGNFEDQLSNFQQWASTQSKPFADGVNAIISSAYLGNLGEGVSTADIKAPTSVTPQVSTADKLASFVDSVGAAYLNSMTAYYKAKGEVANLKLAAQGSAVTQGVNAVQGLTSNPNLLIYGGIGVLALVLLSRR